jgi:hypothetical protein
MATRVIYLDIDDEITSAASRIRTAEGSRVAVVLPNGSRVATSRINFRLLARDAQTNGKQLSVVSGDAATRALAASAGLPVFASVSEYETTQEGDGEPETAPVPEADDDAGGGAPVRPRRRRPKQPAADAPAQTPLFADDTSATAAVVAPPRPLVRTPFAVPAERVVADTSSPERRTAASFDRPTFGGRFLRLGVGRVPLAVGSVVVALALLVGGVGAYLLLPTATAVISPRETTIGPIPLRITASTAATAPDVAAKVVPAVEKILPVDAGQRFPATGERVEETEATGTVRFRNKDFTRSNSIPRGSIVSTAAGVRFRTDRAITVPRAELVGLQIFPASATVDVTAVDAGPEGNVEPNTILTIPRGEDPLTLDVTNPDATTGGAREEFPRITQEDVDAAVAALTTALDATFRDQLDDPALVGDGTTVFPDTATLGPPTFDVDLATLVGQEVDGFDLSASAQGTVLAVDEAPVQAVAEGNIDASVEPGYQLVEGSSVIDPEPAVVENGVVTFPVVVTARQVLGIDPAAIEAEILGKPLAEARTILARYGTVQLSVWPDWVGTVPTFDVRVEVRSATPITVETPGNSPASSVEASP